MLSLHLVINGVSLVKDFDGGNISFVLSTSFNKVMINL